MPRPKSIDSRHKVGQGTIRVGNKQLLVITSALIASTVTQIATYFHHRWYLCLIHWIIQSSTHISCPQLVNSHTALHRTPILITCALIEKTVTQITTICNQRWYMCLLHLIIQSLIHISYPRFVNSHPALHGTILVITGDLIARTVTEREMSCHNRR